MEYENLRVAFEAQMLEMYHPVIGIIDTPWLKRAEGEADYENEYVQGCWVGYQVYRAALVRALPNPRSETYVEYFPDVEGGCFNEAKYIAAVNAALTAAGITVKEGV
ncbi:hypothetical protein EF096_01825 [Pseudomonas neustonica]|uniref:Phage protein n=1 Tax=Pseudomonas neustonica TaxID=2487346 RepID=A0ABX9XNB6_9PSED|nr:MULTISPECIES: hypothetical protein [Pseudomonas]ROZ86930.1 hypothetical protein EF099_00875 [Pseudomonas sp. SSM44]ROZ88454.1 hypothetical protein EF096_01825 [Pseudomonas neustonica]